MSADFVTFISVAQGGAGTTALISGQSGKRHKVVSAVITLDTDGTLKFTDASADLTGAMDLAAKGGFVIPATSYPYFMAAEGSALNIVTTGGGAKGVVGVVTE
jgi:hypothetical protein